MKFFTFKNKEKEVVKKDKKPFIKPLLKKYVEPKKKSNYNSSSAVI